MADISKEKQKALSQAEKLQAIENARQFVENGQDIPNDFCRILFPPEKREYELSYYGKESAEQILSNIIPVPLQEDKLFPPQTTIKENEWINKLIFGENSQILKTLIQMKKDGKLKNADGTNGVRLIYIDPPFATRQEFKVSGADQTAYADKLSGAEFIEFLRKRLILAKELLTDDGSIFVHLDSKMVHYIKLIMDEIFSKNNFINEIIWYYPNSGLKASSKKFHQVTENILWYCKNDDYVFNKLFRERKDGQVKQAKRKFNSITKKADMVRDEDGKIVYEIKENVLVNSMWEIALLSNNPKEQIGYPTQKPEKLLERIIETATNSGDLVMDFFAGSGTTPTVAEKLNRRWIAVDIGKYSIYTMQKRLLRIENIKPFMLYSGGLYDAEKLNKFDSENWKLFALQLWGCQSNKKEIKGFTFDGKKDNCLVKVYSPQELKENGSKVSNETINEINDILGNSAGNEIFIIAPQGQFDFAEDDIEIKDRIYHTLRVPYSMLAKFTENFTPLTQPKDIGSINEIVDAVGFDFIQPPFVDFEIKNNNLIVKEFRSNSRIKGEHKTDLSMILIDYNYNGEVFDLDAVFYNKDLYEKDKDNKSVEIKSFIPIEKIKSKAMFIFVDNAGNEKKVVVNG